MFVTADTHRWNCTACGCYGTVEMTPLVAREAVFDAAAWVERHKGLIGRSIHQGHECYSLFGFPPEAMDELTQFRYPTLAYAVLALRYAVEAAHRHGWKPINLVQSCCAESSPLP